MCATAALIARLGAAIGDEKRDYQNSPVPQPLATKKLDQAMREASGALTCATHRTRRETCAAHRPRDPGYRTYVAQDSPDSWSCDLCSA